MFLVSQGGGRKGDLSRFIEEAVRAHILELTAEQAKAANVNVNEADLTAMVDEAFQWARQHSAIGSTVAGSGLTLSQGQALRLTFSLPAFRPLHRFKRFPHRSK